MFRTLQAKLTSCQPVSCVEIEFREMGGSFQRYSDRRINLDGALSSYLLQSTQFNDQ